MAENRKSTAGGTMRIVVLIILEIIVITLGVLTLKRINSDEGLGDVFVKISIFILCAVLIIKAIYIRYKMNDSLKSYETYEDTKEYRTIKRRKLEQIYPWIALLLAMIALMQNPETDFISWLL